MTGASAVPGVVLQVEVCARRFRSFSAQLWHRAWQFQVQRGLLGVRTNVAKLRLGNMLISGIGHAVSKLATLLRLKSSQLLNSSRLLLPSRPRKIDQESSEHMAVSQHDQWKQHESKTPRAGLLQMDCCPQLRKCCLQGAGARLSSQVSALLHICVSRTA